MEIRHRRLSKIPIITDPKQSATAVGLRYVSDETPGISRKKIGNHFQFIGANRKRITNPNELGRIKSLVIPPAWKEVWICPFENGHLQATGRDDRGRKQHRYHRRWRDVRDETKFNRIILFAKTLPKIRQRVSERFEASRPFTRESSCHHCAAFGNEFDSRRQRRIRPQQWIVWVDDDAGQTR